MRFIACFILAVVSVACTPPAVEAEPPKAPVADGSHATRTAPVACGTVHPVAVETAETLGYGVRVEAGELHAARPDGRAVLEVLFASSANGTCRVRVRADGVEPAASDEQAFLDRLFARLPTASAL